MHAAAARDPILSTQRIRKVKISMVGIYKVKVRLAYLALPHVSHFFPEREPWALKQSTHFSSFERFEILHLPDLLVSLAPPSPSVKKLDLRDGSRADPSEEKRSPCPPLSNSLISMFVWGPPAHIFY